MTAIAKSSRRPKALTKRCSLPCTSWKSPSIRTISCCSTSAKRPYRKYYDALRKVNKLVRDARKVQRCMLLVGEISDIYVDGYRRIVTDTNFSVEELAAIAIGYKRIIEEAAGELKDLGEIINPTDMSLTDKDRIDVVERVYGTLMRHRRLAGYFTRRCISVSLLRARTHRDMERVVALYGTDEQRYW